MARPIGGLIISHFGDKKGRKPALIFTIALMGVSTVAIGVLPTHAQIGIMAPIMLVILRLLQGLGAGAEYAGALVLVAEYVPTKKKGYYTAFVLSATVAGLLLASVIFRLLSQLPEEDLLSWAWRIPFLFSAVLVVVALYIRKHLEETPEYVLAVGQADVQKAPRRFVWKPTCTIAAGSGRQRAGRLGPVHRSTKLMLNMGVS
ncbi:MFS transporter, partial [Verminephrobacter aporrectodeae subsp. tuberculatae]|uniref:MFS transporter n=1 Tax=Verminephrobacter aporrectodeae TaxID=1110389 RepID=UPI002243EB59